MKSGSSAQQFSISSHVEGSGEFSSIMTGVLDVPGVLDVLGVLSVLDVLGACGALVVLTVLDLDVLDVLGVLGVLVDRTVVSSRPSHAGT